MAENVLTVQDLRKAWGEKILFDGLSFGIDRGRKVALLGVNGSGKSTLLRILAGLESDYEGLVTRRANLAFRYLDQAARLGNPAAAGPDALPEGRSVAEAVFAPHGALGALAARYHAALQAGDAKAMAELSAALDREQGWDLYGQAQALAGQFSVDLAWIIAPALSGGQLKKIQIIRALAGSPDLLFLDEPTNHLDEEAIRLLEGKLAGYPGTVVLVTHDRYFLENAVDHILELRQGRIRAYSGNYGRYLEKKAELEESEARADAKRLAFLRSEIDWIRRGPKARGTKAKARIQRYETARDAEGYSTERRILLDLEGGARLGKTILEISGLAKSFAGKPLFRNLDLSLFPGDRIGVLGPNGSGKTTFLKAVLGRIAPDAGEVRLGVNTVPAYFDQKREALDPALTVWQTLGGDAEYVEFGGARMPKRAYLENFLFPARMHMTPAGRLSGGEQSRLQLAAALVARPANLLILDEPTNDLDLATLQALEQALAGFPGCLLAVSHDRYFLDQVATSMLIFADDGTTRLLPGNYSDYLEWQAEKDAEETWSAPAPAPEPPVKKRSSLSYNEKKELEGLEAAIAAKEAAALAAEAALLAANAAGRYEAIQSAAAEHAARQSEVEALYARWEFLEAKARGEA